MMEDVVLVEDAPVPSSEGDAEGEPARWARWLLAGLLLSTYLVTQIGVIIIVLIFKMITGEIVDEVQASAFIMSEAVLGFVLGGAALGALFTVGVAAVWSLLSRFDAGAWIAWRKPQRVRLWLVPLLTVVVMLVVLPLIALTVGEAEVETQMALFSTAPLQVASTLVVTTIVPFAEEFIFRGAFYNALLPGARPGVPAWRRHLAPFLLTSLMFAAIHIPTGFLSAPSILMILLLSCFLGALRAWTGSVRPGVLAHMVWNLFAAIGLILENVLPL
jgi:membrane protease YdiL (CAAX protease family)